MSKTDNNVPADKPTTNNAAPAGLIASLAAPSKTKLELKHPNTDEPLGITFHGYTTESAEWDAAEEKAAKENEKGGKAQIIMGKDEQRMEIDREQGKQRRQLLIQSVTDITGDPNFKFTTDARDELLNNPQYRWMIEQWGAHIDNRKNTWGSTGKAA